MFAGDENYRSNYVHLYKIKSCMVHSSNSYQGQPGIQRDFEVRGMLLNCKIQAAQEMDVVVKC